MAASASARNRWFFASNDWSGAADKTQQRRRYADLWRFQWVAQQGGQRHSRSIRPSRVGWRVRRQAAFSPIELRSGSVGGDNAPQSTQW